jgi:hypothetical protein
MSKAVKMNVDAASRIYSATARSGSGAVPAGSFGARAMGAAMRPTSVAPARVAAADKGRRGK